MKRYLLGLFAVVLAIGFSAFTTSENKARTITQIWFDVNDAGTALDDSEGLPGNNPFGCTISTVKSCSKSFRYDDAVPSNSQVLFNGSVYTLKSGVTVSTDHTGEIKKP